MKVSNRPISGNPLDTFIFKVGKTTPRLISSMRVPFFGISFTTSRTAQKKNGNSSKEARAEPGGEEAVDTMYMMKDKSSTLKITIQSDKTSYCGSANSTSIEGKLDTFSSSLEKNLSLKFLARSVLGNDEG